MPRFRRSREAEPAPLKDAGAIDAAQEIVDLRDRVDGHLATIRSLQEQLGESEAARDAECGRAERAEGQLRYVAIGLRKLAAPAGMTIARRAHLAGLMLAALDVPAAAGEAVAAGEPA